MDGLMDGWVIWIGSMGAWIGGWMNGWMGDMEWIDECMDGWANGWKIGRWIDGKTENICQKFFRVVFIITVIIHNNISLKQINKFHVAKFSL
jgi:hypothetical protein